MFITSSMLLILTVLVTVQGYEPFVSPNIIHQLHIFVVVLALVHVVYSCLTMLLAFTKVIP